MRYAARRLSGEPWAALTAWPGNDPPTPEHRMPYEVQDINSLYADEEMGVGAKTIESYLNVAEEDGWSLVGIIDTHPVWDGNDEHNGDVGAMIILHRPPTPPGTSTTLDELRAKAASRTK